MKTRYVVVLALAVPILAALTACTSRKQQAAAGPAIVHDVQAVTVSQTTVPDVIESVGTVHAAESAQIASQMMGNVVAIKVREGDRVRRGQLLALIDDSQPRAGLERAQATVNAANHEVAAADADYGLAEATMKRYQTLFDKRSVSPQEMDEVKARYQAANARREMARSGHVQARAALAQARTALNYTRIVAPFDGVVTERKVDPGALAAPGMPLLTIEGSGRLRLEATVDESGMRYVRLGETVPVIFDALGTEPFSGKVVIIAPAADPGSHSFLVKVELPGNSALRSGLFGRARFPKGQRSSLVIPRDSIITRGQLQAVYVIGPDGMASIRYVTLGGSSGNQVDVLSGISAGDRVIVAPGDRDLGGKRIEVRG
jgi:RND family efflux transporter MFP subunit